jgi:hypothetical protein
VQELPRRHVAEDLVQQRSQSQARQRQPLVNDLDLLAVVLLIHRAAVSPVPPSPRQRVETAKVLPQSLPNLLATDSTGVHNFGCISVPIRAVVERKFLLGEGGFCLATARILIWTVIRTRSCQSSRRHPF